MSRIPELGEKYSKLPDILAEYEDALEEAQKILVIKGKKLENANVENPTWQNYYDQRRIELNTLVRYFETEIQRERSRLYRKYKENHSYELGEREIGRYIDGESTFLSLNELLLEVKELYEKYQAVVSAFTSRGYALNNITKIRVASLDHVEL